LSDERCETRTAKSRGSGVPTLTPSWRRCFQHRGLRRRQESPVSGKSAKETVKTIAQETPDCTGQPVVTLLVCFHSLRTRLRVRRRIRRFLRPPLSEGNEAFNPGAPCRGNAKVRRHESKIELFNQTHPSSLRNQGPPRERNCAHREPPTQITAMLANLCERSRSHGV
jgi:transposase-like protein